MKDHLKNIESLIRSGNIADAKKHLRKMSATKIPSRDRLLFSQYARRAYLPSLGIKVLARTVIGGAGFQPSGTPAEVAEYAACLIRVGGSKEAISLLDGLDKKLPTEGLLFKAIAYINQWSYAEAIPLLQAYIKSEEITDYQRAVGKVNLASALVFEKSAEAKMFLDETLKHTKEAGYRYLYIITYLSALELSFYEKNWSEAKKLLSEAENLNLSSQPLEYLFFKKWEAVIQYGMEKNIPELLSKLAWVRKEALRLNHPETLRSSDHLESTLSQDEDLFCKVYFGTPYETFKKRLLRDWNKNIELPSVWNWSEQGKIKQVVNIDSLIQKEMKDFSPGSLLHRLLVILCRDMYRSFRTAELHSQLYPDIHYNPSSSPVKIYQAIKRLKIWLEQEKLPLSLLMTSRGYQLKLDSNTAIRISNSQEVNDLRGLRINQIRNWFGGSDFSAKEVANKMGTSVWTVIRLLREAKKSGSILSSGSGNQVRYRFPQENSQKAA